MPGGEPNALPRSARRARAGRGRSRWAEALLVGLGAVLVIAASGCDPRPAAGPGSGTDAGHAADAVDAAGERTIREAFENRRSGVEVTAAAVVDRILRDDLEGSRHQRFVVRMSGGQTVLISHNIDLAPRVPVEVGDRVRFRGRYEWNDRGGVVHWTHHDPDRRREGGWIEHLDESYD